jgi:hypothetical protein
MSRTAKLNETEVASVLALKGKVPVEKLTKKLKVSRSTIYRIFEGSYQARPAAPSPMANLAQMDETTLATVQFVLAKTNLEKLIGHPIQIH